VLDSKSLKIKEVLNQDFMEIEILSIAEGLNRNNSYFTLESMEKGIPTFYNKFIMGYYRVNNIRNGEGVFEEHNSDIRYDKELDEFYWSYTAANAEKPLGLVRESDKVEIVEQDGKKWIKLTAVILTKYNREAVKHLLKSKGKRKVSVEVTVIKSHEKEGIEIIEEFVLDAITILGNRKNSTVLCEEGIEGASMKILNFEQVLQKQKEAVCFAYKELDNNLSTNEKEETITMDVQSNLENNESLINNSEEMEGLALTYEQKRDILESVLREQKCSEMTDYVWVADLSDTEVFFCYNGDYFKTTYTWDEESETKCIIDFDSAVKVVRDWKEYSANDEEDIEEKTVEANTTQQFSEENEQEISVEDDKKEFVENAEKEEIENEEEFVSFEENKEDDKVENEEKTEENFVDSEEEDEKEADETDDEKQDNCNYSETEEGKEEEDKNFVEEKEVCEKCGQEKCECSVKEDEEDKEVCEECGKEKCECSVEEEKENFQEKYDSLTKEYEALKEGYSLLETEKQELQEKLEKIEFEQKNTEMLTYGYELINKEASLDKEDVETLRSSFAEACESKRFTEEKQVEDFMEDTIPKLFYKRHKNEKINKSKEEDFSMQFSNPTKKVSEETSIDKMRNLLKIN
jgi:hypothetical protein